MKRVYSLISLMTTMVLLCSLSMSYAQCNDDNSYLYGGKKVPAKPVSLWLSVSTKLRLPQ